MNQGSSRAAGSFRDTSYDYRAVASNAFGIVVGANMTFTEK